MVSCGNEAEKTVGVEEQNEITKEEIAETVESDGTGLENLDTIDVEVDNETLDHDTEQLSVTDEQEYKHIDVFDDIIESNKEYDISYLGRLSDKLYFTIEDIGLTNENGVTTYFLYQVSYDFDQITALGEINCDYLAREDNSIYMTIPERSHDKQEILVYSDNSIYFYNLQGELSHYYVVFGEGNAPWNENIESIGDVKEWYVYSGMTIIAFNDDEGWKYYNGFNEHTYELEGIPELSDDCEQGLQEYFDENFGSRTILVDNELFDEIDIMVNLEDSNNIVKILYQDNRMTVIMMKDEVEGLYFVKSKELKSMDSIQILNVEVSTYTQKKEANMVINPESKLPSPHWSDDIMIRFANIYDPNLEKLIKHEFPNAVFIQDSNDLIFTIPVSEQKIINIPIDMFEENGYILNEAIAIEYSGTDFDYHMTRWNKDRTEKLLYSEDIEDDYFCVEIGFYEEVIEQERIEEVIYRNIDYYESSKVLPKVEFEWVDKQHVYVTVTEMEVDQDYVISLNGYITNDGTCHYTWSSCHGFIGALEEYYEGFYDFTKIGGNNIKCIEYNYLNQTELEVGVIHQYNYLVGPSVGDFVSTGLSDEWGYYAYIYDMSNDQIYDNDIHSFVYYDFFEYKSRLYLTDRNGINRVDDNGTMTLVYEQDYDHSFYTVRKNPNSNQFMAIGSGEGNQTDLYLLDDNFSLINKVTIDYWLLGFYRALIEPYWLDDDTVVITGNSLSDRLEGEMVTKSYNINTGEVESTMKNKKLMTISADGEFMLMQDTKYGENISIYNREFELQGEMTIDSNSDNASYQYMDYWYGHILYIKYYDQDEVFKWNLDTGELTVLELPYENFVIDKVLGEDNFRVFINMKILPRSNPYWS